VDGSGYLGLDCGGTKTRWAWWGGRLAGGETDGVQPAVHGSQAAGERLAAAVRLALAGHSASCTVAAVAGAGAKDVRDALVAAVGRHEPGMQLVVVGDVLAAAVGAIGSEAGLLIWSGTGSFLVAQDGDGRLLRIGGRGYLLSDEGSGYDFVRRAARSAIQAHDGMAPETLLGERLCAEFGAPSIERLGAVMQQRTTGEVARALVAVAACAREGDAVARQVLADGVAALFTLADAAVARAGLRWQNLKVVLGGGVFDRLPEVRDAACAWAKERGARRPELAPVDAAARGAAHLARAVHLGEEPLCSQVLDVSL
jgi:glucosamine kinase